MSETRVNMTLADRIDTHDKEWKTLFREVSNSGLWKAIEKFISKAPVKECGLIDKKGPLHYPRGQGAFFLKKIYVYPAGAGKECFQTVRFAFDVYWYDEDESVHNSSCMIDAPVALLNEFNQDEFDKWAKQKDAELRSRDVAYAKEQLEKLYADFPELKG